MASRSVRKTTARPHAPKAPPKPKTRSGRIFQAFIASLDDLSPLVGKVAPAELRRKTWQSVRRRVPGVTQAVVTRTLYRAVYIIECRPRLEGLTSRRKRRAAP